MPIVDPYKAAINDPYAGWTPEAAQQRLVESGLTPEQAQTEMGGLVDPWLDPTFAFSLGAGAVGKIALKGGAKLLPAIGRGLLGGTTAAITEYPIGGTTEVIAGGKYPELALPFAMVTGILTGLKLEAPVEKLIIKGLNNVFKKRGAVTAKDVISIAKGHVTDTQLKGVQTKLAETPRSIVEQPILPGITPVMRNVVESPVKLPKGKALEVAIQRRTKGKPAIAIYKHELDIIKGLPDIKQTQLTPSDWYFDRLGKEAKDLFYWPVKQAEKIIHTKTRQARTFVKGLSRGLPRKSSERIMLYAASRQKAGENTLKAMGKEIPELTPKEMNAYTEMRVGLEHFYNQLQEARILAGKEPFPKVENYFTFFRAVDDAAELGKTPLDIDGRWLHERMTPFGFAKARKFDVGDIDLDAFRVYNKYAKAAIKHIEMAEPLARGRELMKTFGTKQGKDRFLLSEESPQTARALTEWLDVQSGKRQVGEYFRTPDVMVKALMRLSKSMTWAVLSFNARSVTVQGTAIVGTYAEIGEVYLAKGIANLFNPQSIKDAFKQSHVLSTRFGSFDANVADAMAQAGLSKGAFGKVQKAVDVVGYVGMLPLGMLDLITATASWMGAFRKAIKVDKLSREAARKYADALVVRTQASAMGSDIAPIQRTALGKAAVPFQTWVIRNWTFLTREVLGIGNPAITNKQAMKKVVRLLLGYTLINMFYEDILGINSPFPTPKAAYNLAKRKGESKFETARRVGKEIVEPIPIVGGAIRYGSTPLGAIAQVAGEVTMLGAGRHIRTTPYEVFGKIAGVPGTVEIGKYLRGRKRGETQVGSIIGRYTEKKKGLSTAQRKRKKRGR